MAPPLLLASASPRRRAILAQLGIEFEVVVSGAEEAERGPADEVALTNARRKARAVAARRPGRRVLGVDTVVALDGRLYGKPADRDDAARTLRALAGCEHRVVGGICLIDPGEAPGPPRPDRPQGAAVAGVRERTAVAVTNVSFRALDGALLEWYLDSGEWRGRAGGYAIQGRGAALVAAIRGDYLNVVGLPVNALLQLEPSLLLPHTRR